MKVLFVVKIKNENAPEFKQGLGKGVVAKEFIEFESDDEVQIANAIVEKKQALLEKYFEVNEVEMTSLDEEELCS